MPSMGGYLLVGFYFTWQTVCCRKVNVLLGALQSDLRRPASYPTAMWQIAIWCRQRRAYDEGCKSTQQT